MTLYSIIQYSSVAYLYYKATILTDNQYLYVDIPVLILSFLMNFGKSSNVLTKDKPVMGLLSFQVLGSVFLSIIIVLVFQIAAIIILVNQPFYIQSTDLYTSDELDDSETATYENDVLIFNFLQIY